MIEEVITEIEARDAVRTILRYIGEDPRREGLIHTPERVIHAWDEMMVGYQQDPVEVLGVNFDRAGYDQMITIPNIEFYSCCEHHMLPFFGRAWVAYVPGSRVVGLSKIARLVDVYARRLQIQERMTRQISDTIQSVLKPRGVGVVIRATHLCMKCRGVMKQHAEMITTSLIGVFRQHKVREEFLNWSRS
jgi:GTP cyclohydrolase I